jgi:hypothetical protein
VARIRWVRISGGSSSDRSVASARQQQQLRALGRGGGGYVDVGGVRKQMAQIRWVHLDSSSDQIFGSAKWQEELRCTVHHRGSDVRTQMAQNRCTGCVPNLVLLFMFPLLQGAGGAAAAPPSAV